jgi:hypothetical protein
MSDINLLNEPKPDIKDLSHSALKGVIAAIPGIGSLAAEAFATVFEAPLARRRAEWIKSIAAGLMRLEKEVEGISLDKLSNNEMFITTAMHATQAVIRNHQKEKLEMLRNVVLNAALPNAPEEDVQFMFLSFIDTLTPSHMKILALLNDPLKWINEKGIHFDLSSRPDEVLQSVFTDMNKRRKYYDLLAMDLFSRGLVKLETLQLKINAYGQLIPLTTYFGRRFLEFVTSPLKNK